MWKLPSHIHGQKGNSWKRFTNAARESAAHTGCQWKCHSSSPLGKITKSTILTVIFLPHPNQVDVLIFIQIVCSFEPKMKKNPCKGRPKQKLYAYLKRRSYSLVKPFLTEVYVYRQWELSQNNFKPWDCGQIKSWALYFYY